jgi:hypothetical protein
MRTAIAVGGSVLALSACGGHTATKQDVIAQGNAICASELRDIRAVPAPGSVNSLADLSTYLGQVAPILGKEVKSLEALPRASRDRPLLERFIAAVVRDGVQYRALASAAAAGNRAGVESALNDLRLSPEATLASAYGLSQCATAGGTAAP